MTAAHPTNAAIAPNESNHKPIRSVRCREAILGLMSVTLDGVKS